MLYPRTLRSLYNCAVKVRPLNPHKHHSPILCVPRVAQLSSMPPKQTSTNGKRKAIFAPEVNGAKKVKVVANGIGESSSGSSSGVSSTADSGIVLRKFYPPEMNNSRCQQYNNNQLPRPIELLTSALEETKSDRENISIRSAVVHWFKSDLRTHDNTALSLASQKAKEGGVPLLCLYLISPQDFEAHLTAPVRVDFILRTLSILRADLAKLDIPLYVETVERRHALPGRILELLGEWNASHLYANAEYEVDELRRDAALVRTLAQNDIAADVLHDTCVVAPGELESGSGNQYAVYTPWFRAWCAHINKTPSLLELVARPGKNPAAVRTDHTYKPLFGCEIPEAPENKRLSKEDQKRLAAMWPAGELEAHARLEKFAKERMKAYAEARNFPADNGTSSLSVHLAAGTLSARTAVRKARDFGGTKKVDAAGPGIQTWISEVAWRDFYRHVLTHWPYVCMNKPFKPAYSHIAWQSSPANLNAWHTGKTGYPIVDAAMRQLTTTGWMHNRLRMIVASFLAKHLLLDWRLGEQFFMLNLIDGDFSSNNGGWGWSASSGVDPQPYFRIFNPLLQSEKFDKEGKFIRKWVPELKDLDNKAIHAPYDRGGGKVAEKNGYPKPVVEHKMARERALAAYKEALSGGGA